MMNWILYNATDIFYLSGSTNILTGHTALAAACFIFGTIIHMVERNGQ
jgi:hypothetical protein